jgi:hypothetical protein
VSWYPPASPKVVIMLCCSLFTTHTSIPSSLTYTLLLVVVVPPGAAAEVWQGGGHLEHGRDRLHPAVRQPALQRGQRGTDICSHRAGQARLHLPALARHQCPCKGAALPASPAGNLLPWHSRCSCHQLPVHTGLLLYPTPGHVVACERCKHPASAHVACWHASTPAP